MSVWARSSCVLTINGAIEDVSDNAGDRLINFDENGDHLIYGEDAIGKGGAPLGIHVADFATRIVRKVAVVSGQMHRRSFVDPNRVVVQGYDGATVFDLAKGWSMPIITVVESEGFASNGNAKRFLVGKAASSSTNLFWVDLPD